MPVDNLDFTIDRDLGDEDTPKEQVDKPVDGVIRVYKDDVLHLIAWLQSLI